MTRMLLVADVADSIKKHQAQIITSLKDPDIRYPWEQLWFLLCNNSDPLHDMKMLYHKVVALVFIASYSPSVPPIMKLME